MFQLFDFYWKNNKESSDFTPFLKLRNLDNDERARLHLGKDLKEFNYNLSKQKYCIGYYDQDGWKKCINTYSNGIGFKLWRPYDSQCFNCEKAQGFKSAFFFGEDPNEQTRKYLEQKHYIYLAYFYPNTIKVGTAASSREGVRLVEQDALVYAYIAETDGFNVQKLERAISKEMHITETVRSNQKFKNLGNKPNTKNAQELLKSNIDSVIHHFRNSEYKDWFYSKEKIEICNIIDDKDIYYPNQTVTLLTPDYFKGKESVPLVGKYLGLRGRYILFENNTEIFAIDTRFLTGRTIDYIEEYKYKEQSDEIKLI